MTRISDYGLACRLLSIFLILFQSSCALSPQARDQLNAGNAVTSDTFIPQVGGYCVPGIGDIFDATSLKLSQLAPNTYCLFDNFGVDRTVVLSVLEKYRDVDPVTTEDAEDINSSLHVQTLIQRIVFLKNQPENAENSIQYPVRIASLGTVFIPVQVAQTQVIPTVFELTETLATLLFTLPRYAIFIQNHPELFDSQTIQQNAENDAENVTSYANATVQQIQQVIDDAKQIISDDFCKNLNCDSVTETDASVEVGTCPPNSACPPPKIQTCQDSVLESLQDRKNNICGAARSCVISDTKEQIIQKISANSRCIEARRDVTNTCYGGVSDAVHDEQIANRVAAIQYCQYLLGKKK